MEVRDIRNDVRDVRNEVGDIRNDVREVKSGLHENTSSLKSLAQKVDLLSNQFKDVAGVVIKNHHQRIDLLEERVGALEAEVH